jgi:hypothetical protein
MRRDMLSSTESHRLGRGMRLTRDIIIRYKGVLGVIASQIINKRMMRLGKHSTSY